MTKRTYQQYCPVAEALDVVGERWTLLIVRELLSGPKRYRDLKAALPGMASNLLGDRLTELVDLGVVERIETPDAPNRPTYELTPAGRELEGVIRSLARWGMRRLPPPGPDTEVGSMVALRAALLAYARPGIAAGERRVYEIALGPDTFTVTIAEGAITYKAGPPLREAPDVTLTTEPAVLMEVRLGQSGVDEVLADGRLDLAGTPEAVAEFRLLFAVDQPTPREPVSH